MWNLGTYGKVGEREDKRLLIIENKLRIDGRRWVGEGLDGDGY